MLIPIFGLDYFRPHERPHKKVRRQTTRNSF